MVLYPHTYKKLNYDPLADFIPVTHDGHLRLLVHRRPRPAGRDQDRGRLRRSGPRPIPKLANYGVPAAGLGAALRRHDAAEGGRHRVEQRAPTAAARRCCNDVLGGQVPVSFNVIGEVLPHIRVRQAALARRDQRAALALPARRADAGRSRATRTSRCRSGWAGSCRRKTPAETVRSLNALVREALQAPDMVAAAGAQFAAAAPPVAGGVRPHASRPTSQRWAPIVKATGFTAEE